MLLSCAGNTACRGRLTIEVLERRTLASGRRRYVTVGRARFAVGPGKRATVRVKLSPAARAALRKRGRLAARLVARTGGSATTRAVTLRG